MVHKLANMLQATSNSRSLPSASPRRLTTAGKEKEFAPKQNTGGKKGSDIDGFGPRPK
jgi:hypothetical protein